MSSACKVVFEYAERTRLFGIYGADIIKTGNPETAVFSPKIGTSGKILDIQ
jgi:hypothetical protein